MRREFVPVLSEHAETKQTEDEIRSSICPWVAEIIAVESGYMCFESVEDCRAWKSQK